jgi:hypothetical protein
MPSLSFLLFFLPSNLRVTQMIAEAYKEKKISEPMLSAPWNCRVSYTRYEDPSDLLLVPVFL